MKKYMNMSLMYTKNLLRNGNFWRVQWLNIEYTAKYVAKYKLIILLYSLGMSYLYIGLSEELTQKQSQAMIETLVLLYVMIRQIFFLTGFVRLILFPTDDNVLRKNRINTCLKQLLYLLMVMSSSYLKTDTISSITSIESIPKQVYIEGFSSVFTLLVMYVCIKQFWEQLDQQMLITDFSRREPLDTDICTNKVSFSNGWEKMIRVLEVGITYRYNQSGNLYMIKERNDLFRTDSTTARVDTVTVGMKYSTITRELLRLNAPTVIAKNKSKKEKGFSLF